MRFCLANVAWGGGQMLGAVGGGFLAGAAGFLLPALVTVVIIGGVAVVARGTVQPMASEILD